MNVEEKCTCGRKSRIGKFCSVFHALEEDPTMLFDSWCDMNQIKIGNEFRVHIISNNETIDSICNNNARLLSIEINFKKEYQFLKDCILSGTLGGSGDSDEIKKIFDEVYKLPPLFDKAPEISLDYDALDSFYELLQSSKIKLPRGRSVYDYITLIKEAIKNKNYESCLEKIGSRWYFQSNELLLCYLLMPGSMESIRVCEAALTELIIQRSLDMKIVDIQSYVAKKMLNRPSGWLDDVNIVIPDSSNIGMIKLMIGIDDIHGAEQLTDTEYVSFVAMNSTNILGFITCSLHDDDMFPGDYDRDEVNDNFKIASQYADESDLFNIFSIDIVYVSTIHTYQPLREFLLYNALHFVQKSASDLGIRLVVSRQTEELDKLRFLDFGFHYIDGSGYLDWMRQTLDKKKLLLDEFMDRFALLNKTNLLLQYKQSNSNDSNWDLLLSLEGQKIYPNGITEELLIKERNQIAKDVDESRDKYEKISIKKFILDYRNTFHIKIDLTNDEENDWKNLSKHYTQYSHSIKWTKNRMKEYFPVESWNMILSITSLVFQQKMKYYDNLKSI